MRWDDWAADDDVAVLGEIAQQLELSMGEGYCALSN